jgi:hypothetical protein
MLLPRPLLDFDTPASVTRVDGITCIYYYTGLGFELGSH